jgi:hypothetical protein
MRWPQWLRQMLAMLGARAGVPSPVHPAAVRAELDDLDRLARADVQRFAADDATPTPRLCQRCMQTRPLCRCLNFAVLPVTDAAQREQAFSIAADPIDPDAVPTIRESSRAKALVPGPAPKEPTPFPRGRRNR